MANIKTIIKRVERDNLLCIERQKNKCQTTKIVVSILSRTDIWCVYQLIDEKWRDRMKNSLLSSQKTKYTGEGIQNITYSKKIIRK